MKTSILILDKRVHKQTDSVLFVKVQNDGFNLGAQLRAVVNSDLPEATRLLRSWMTAPQAFEGDGVMAQAVARGRIGENGDFGLSGERYVLSERALSSFEMTTLDTLCELVRGSSPRPQGDPTYFGGPVPRLMVADITRDGMRVTPRIDTLTEEGAKKSRPMLAGSVVMAVSGNPGLPAILQVDACIHDGFVGFRDLDTSRLLPEFLYYVLLANKESNKAQSVGAVFMNLTTDQIRAFSIPIPPLEVQRQIVAEIEGYQKIIDGARQVLDHYKPHIAIDPAWPIKTLRDACKAILTGPFGTALHESDYVAEGIPVINPKNIVDGQIMKSGAKAVSAETRDKLQEFTVRENDIVIGRRGEMGRCAVVAAEMNGWLCGTGCFVIRLNEECDTRFAHLQISSPAVKAYLEAQAVGVTMMNLNQGILTGLQFPLPTLETQRAIVAEIEAEQALVNANRELVRRMEAKVKATIDRVWG